MAPAMAIACRISGEATAHYVPDHQGGNSDDHHTGDRPKVRQQDGITDIHQDTDQRREQQYGAARPSAMPIRGPLTGATRFTTAPRASGNSWARMTCRADRRRINDPVGTQYPIADDHPQRQRRHRQNGQAIWSVGAKPAWPPDANARRKASGAPGAIAIKTTPTCSGKAEVEREVVANPIAGTMTSTLMRPRINRDGERRCRIDSLGVMVVPMAAITENTVMNERTLTSHSGMISTTA